MHSGGQGVHADGKPNRESRHDRHVQRHAFNPATRTDATGRAGTQRPTVRVVRVRARSGAPGPQDGGRAARLAYRLVTALGGMGR